MEITATELKLNLGKYLEASNDEVIVIMKNGKEVAKLIGTRTFKYDFSELEEFEAKMRNAFVVGEADSWLLTHNGETVAQLKPVLKEKPKRRLGFIKGPPASEEENKAIMESDYTDEDYERWLNEEW